MENQHRKIIGYRELSQDEINAMNEIKSLGNQLGELITKVKFLDVESQDTTERTAMDLDRHNWSKQAELTLKTGIMQLTRAVALPTSF